MTHTGPRSRTGPATHGETVDGLRRVDPREWDALAGEGAFHSSHHWLLAHESMPGLATRYVLLRSGPDEGSELLAAAPVSFTKYELTESYGQQRFAEAFGPGVRYALFGARRGYRNPLLVSGAVPAERRPAVVAELVRAALRACEELGAQALVAPYLPEEALGALTAAGTVRCSAPAPSEAVLALAGGGFEDYLSTLPSHRRVSIRHERAALRELGLTLAVEEVRPGCAGQLAGPLAQVERKYGSRATVPGLRRYLTDTFEDDPGHARLFTCRDAEGALVSAMLGYEWERGLYARATATDYERLPPGAFAYFNVVYYEPVEYCLSRGLSTVYFGLGALGTKRARGCRELPLRHALLHA
ncbi:GNAT family N-acetyltransferase [Kitasatospora sp. NPDC051853]|uniref:GNAT family N-acetyltransferase n=1 Tax=Kitasatospora sp. NPDC051853 TaxID=3364058 RepID=UPI00379EB8B0